MDLKKYICISDFYARSPIKGGMGDYYNLYNVKLGSIWKLLYRDNLSGYYILFDEDDNNIMINEDDMKKFMEIKENDCTTFNKFTKEDIKQGYKVKLRDGEILDMDTYMGEKYFRANKMDADVGCEFWIPICPLSDFTDDLIYYGGFTENSRKYNHSWDIMWVYDCDDNMVFSRYNQEKELEMIRLAELAQEKIDRRKARREKIKSFISKFYK